MVFCDWNAVEIVGVRCCIVENGQRKSAASRSARSNFKSQLQFQLSRLTLAFFLERMQGLEAVNFYFIGDDSRFGNEEED
jgi:hypothetical protein